MLTDFERECEAEGGGASVLDAQEGDDDDDRDDTDDVDAVGSSSSSLAPTFRTLGRFTVGTTGRSVDRFAAHSRIAFLTHTKMKIGEREAREGRRNGVGRQKGSKGT